jgi:hypothetical protein
MAGELPQAIQLEIEQLPQPQSGAAQQDDPSPGHDIVELMNGGHECSVDVGWHSSGQWCEKAGKVTAVQNQGRWPVGPTQIVMSSKKLLRSRMGMRARSQRPLPQHARLAS